MIKDIDLPKWPRLLVVGDNITPDQAGEIIIRTNNWRDILNSNDNNFFMNKIKKIYKENIPLEELISEINFHKSIKHISLNYLYNDRIDSFWVGGLRGWCNWDGTIFCNNYNVGKWPQIKDIIYDLNLIIENFSYLDFRLQLLDTDFIEDNTNNIKPLTSLEIKKQKIKEMDIDYLITPLVDEESLKQSFSYAIDQTWKKDQEHIERITKAIKKIFS